MKTYHGYVETTDDAILLLEACRLGRLSRVQRRLSDEEMQSIQSGSVFVWDKQEADIERWTDGRPWSVSQVSGSFFTYHEMEGKRGRCFSTSRRGYDKTPDSGRGSDENRHYKEPGRQQRKADGLVKKLFSTTYNDRHLHLISYYYRRQPGQPELQQPTNDPALRDIVPDKGMYTKLNMDEANTTPALTRPPMQQPPYAGPQPGQQPHDVYGQPGSSHTPSPTATPPYKRHISRHLLTAPQQYPLHDSYPGLSLPNYVNTAVHEHPGLLSVLSDTPYTANTFPHYAHPTLPRDHEPSSDQHFESVGQSAAGDARPSSSHTSQVALPRPGALANGPTGASLVAIITPPGRTMNDSPPGNSRFYESRLPAPRAVLQSACTGRSIAARNVAGLDATTFDSSECVVVKGGFSEDARALKLLDRKFCI